MVSKSCSKIRMAAVTAAVFGTIGLAAHARAATVSLQFDGHDAGQANYYGAITSNQTSAGAAPATHWNYQTDGIQNAEATSGSHFISTASSNGGVPNASSLLDNTGTLSGVTYSYSYTRVSGTEGSGFTSGSGDALLASEAAGVQNTTSNTVNNNATLTLSGLTGTYDIYAEVGPMYFGGGAEAVGLGGTTYYLNPSSSLSTWSPSTDSSNTGTPTTANYVKFTGLTGASQTLTVFGNGNAYGLNGVQIVSSASAVPTPATGVLGAIGLGLLWFSRKRKLV